MSIDDEGVAHIERVAEEIEARKHPAPEVPKPPKPPQPKRRLWPVILGWIFGLAAIAVIVLVAIMAPRAARRHTAEVARWNALVRLGTCVRNSLRPDPVLKETAASTDPRPRSNMFPQFARLPDPLCYGDTDALLTIDSLAYVQGVMTDWRTAFHRIAAAESALETYFKKADWRDDNYASGEAKWREAHDAATAGIATANAMRDRVLSIADTEIHRYVMAYDDRKGKDATYWQAELGYRMQVASDDALRGDTAKVASDMADFTAAVAAAPLDARRATRGFFPSPGFENTLLQSLAGRRTPIPDP